MNKYPVLSGMYGNAIAGDGAGARIMGQIDLDAPTPPPNSCIHLAGWKPVFPGEEEEPPNSGSG